MFRETAIQSSSGRAHRQPLLFWFTDLNVTISKAGAFAVILNSSQILSKRIIRIYMRCDSERSYSSSSVIC